MVLGSGVFLYPRKLIILCIFESFVSCNARSLFHFFFFFQLFLFVFVGLAVSAPPSYCECVCITGLTDMRFVACGIVAAAGNCRSGSTGVCQPVGLGLYGITTSTCPPSECCPYGNVKLNRAQEPAQLRFNRFTGGGGGCDDVPESAVYNGNASISTAVLQGVLNGTYFTIERTNATTLNISSASWFALATLITDPSVDPVLTCCASTPTPTPAPPSGPSKPFKTYTYYSGLNCSAGTEVGQRTDSDTCFASEENTCVQKKRNNVPYAVYSISCSDSIPAQPTNMAVSVTKYIGQQKDCRGTLQSVKDWACRSSVFFFFFTFVFSGGISQNRRLCDKGFVFGWLERRLGSLHMFRRQDLVRSLQCRLCGLERLV